MRLRQAISNLGFTSTLAFKADIYTQIGIYGENEWGLPEIIYTA
jgi:hypothetical protein